MSEWESGKINDFGKVVTGKTPPTSDKEFYKKGYKFVTPTDLGFNSYYINQTGRQVSEKARNRYPNYFLPPESVSYTCIGATIGKSCLNREYVLTNQQINSIIPNEFSNARFIYYYLNALTPSIVAVAGGAATPIVNKSSFENIKINLPPLQTQQKIAKILSNYDDLIENNLKRIKLLEESARLTYEDWFLRFRIDGKKLDIDPATDLPFGWVKNKLISICENFTDGTHDSPNQVNDIKGKYLITGKHLMSNKIDFSTAYRISESDHLQISRRSGLKTNDILFSNIGTLCNVAKVGNFTDFSCKNVFIFRPRKKMDSFLFEFLKNEKNKENFIQLSSGSTQKFISLEFMRKFQTIMAPTYITEQFHDTYTPLYSEISNLIDQNQLLKEARDILLPRLMTGMIDTDDMDIAI